MQNVNRHLVKFCLSCALVFLLIYVWLSVCLLAYLSVSLCLCIVSMSVCISVAFLWTIFPCLCSQAKLKKHFSLIFIWFWLLFVFSVLFWVFFSNYGGLTPAFVSRMSIKLMGFIERSIFLFFLSVSPLIIPSISRGVMFLKKWKMFYLYSWILCRHFAQLRKL